ncbi:hypothetical protein BD410DRAFT_586856 [Rickenella mellea]|uniref:Uncharacterized protein n=1 Tax=Rickenella mellea TaxID=50990 RepID=A0A4Y7PNE9_9AGAM|nr:hypothetical protein BD410DRAFT_586856 [Rickenella mellea]
MTPVSPAPWNRFSSNWGITSGDSVGIYYQLLPPLRYPTTFRPRMYAAQKRMSTGLVKLFLLEAERPIRIETQLRTSSMHQKTATPEALICYEGFLSSTFSTSHVIHHIYLHANLSQQSHHASFAATLILVTTYWHIQDGVQYPCQIKKFHCSYEDRHLEYQ